MLEGLHFRSACALIAMLVTIGKVLKPWGVKGEMKIESLTDFPERFRSLTRVFLTSPKGKQLSCPVAGAQVRNGVPYLRFEGYDVPEKARELAGMLVQVPEEETVPLPEGSYYWYELMGMEVVSETGEALGTIGDIFRTGSNDVYVVKRGRKEFSLPATKEVIRQVDRKAKRMVIHVMEGLLE